MCYCIEKLINTKHINENKFRKRYFLNLKGSIIMKKVKFNKKKFFRFVFLVSILAVVAFAENGNITGALVLAMLI